MIEFISLHLDVDTFRCLKKIYQNNFQKSITLEKRAWYFCNPEHNLNHAENTHPRE